MEPCPEDPDVDEGELVGALRPDPDEVEVAADDDPDDPDDPDPDPDDVVREMVAAVEVWLSNEWAASTENSPARATAPATSQRFTREISLRPRSRASVRGVRFMAVRIDRTTKSGVRRACESCYYANSFGVRSSIRSRPRARILPVISDRHGSTRPAERSVQS